MGEALCGNPATHRFTWPGREESFICQEHLPKLQGVCSAMGMYCQFNPVHESDFAKETCRQKVKV